MLLCIAPLAHAELTDVANRARAGCARAQPRAPLRSSPALAMAALRMASGQSLNASLASAGYVAAHSSALHLSGVAGDADVGRILAAAYCSTLSDQSLTDMGAGRRGRDVYLVFAAPAPVPRAADAAEIGREILGRVNEARAAGRRCGGKYYPAVQPLTLNPLLNAAALAHSQEMAAYGAFDHRGHDGSSPAVRVERAGYVGYRVVGENIAAGAMTPRQVAEGWLASPAHCENIMDARFTHIGIAFAVNFASPEVVYWTQDFAVPRGAAPPKPR